MKISGAGEFHPAQTQRKAAAAGSAPAPKSGADNPAEDTLLLSDEGRQAAAQRAREQQFAAELALYEKERNRQPDFDPQWFRDQLEQANKQAQSIAKCSDQMRRCYKIALNIMSGDNVPFQDRRYLAKYDSGMYSRAIMLRRQKEDPEDRKRVTKDEKPEQVRLAQSGAVITDEGGIQPDPGGGMTDAVPVDTPAESGILTE